MKNKFFIFIWLFFIGSSVHANVRVIGNGGGETEMRALTEFSVVRTTLKMVAENEDNPFLNISATEELRKLLETISDQWHLKFVSQDEEYTYDYGQNLIIMDPDKLKISRVTMSQYLLNAWLNVSAKATPDLVQILVDRVFPSDDWEFVSMRHSRGNLMIFKNTYGLTASIKYRTKWISLKGLLANELKSCPIQDLEIMDIFQIQSHAQGYRLNLTWRCQGEESAAQALLKNFDDNQWKLILFALRS